MSRPRVLVTGNMTDVPLDAFIAQAEVLLPRNPLGLMGRSEVLDQAAGLAAIINWGDLRVDDELLEAAPRLRIVSNATAGFDNLDVPRMTQFGVWAANAPEAFTECTADLTFGLLLAMARGIVRADAFLRAGGWPAGAERMALAGGILLQGKTLGIIGFGRIGQAVARRALGFGMHVIYYDEGVHDRSFESRTLEALLAEADIVSLHVPLTSQTIRLMDADRFSQMKRGAMFMNVSRGRVVDERALIAALRSGHLAGAALDVFECEPAVPDDLRSMEHVVLTPHIGAAVMESQRAALRRCVENVAAVLAGKEPRDPLNLVTPKRAPDP